MTDMEIEMTDSNINDCSNQKDVNQDESNSFLTKESGETTKSLKKDDIFWRIIVLMASINRVEKFRY